MKLGYCVWLLQHLKHVNHINFSEAWQKIYQVCQAESFKKKKSNSKYFSEAKKHASSHSQPSPHQVTSPDIVHSTSTTSSSDSSISTPNSFETNLNFALSSVGFPVIQAGVSTDFCALPLGFMELYMAKMFALSLTLCVSLSLIHGLIVIPALLSVQHHIVHAVKRCFGRN